MLWLKCMADTLRGDREPQDIMRFRLNPEGTGGCHLSMAVIGPFSIEARVEDVFRGEPDLNPGFHFPPFISGD